MATSSQRRRHAKRASGRALSGCEQLEPRQLLTVNIITAIADQTLATNAPAQSISLAGLFDNPDVTGTVVRFATNSAAPNDKVFVELFDQAGPGRTRTTPLTTANFLAYANAGRFQNTILHRTVPGFIVQAGGFTQPTAPSGQPGGSPATIATYAPVQNEPGNSNIRGTIAMAKVGGDPNSATDQWFFNLADNRTNLDSQNGGFTAFGQVLGTGMSVVDSLAAIPFYRASDFYNNGALTDLPLRNMPNLIPNPLVIQPSQFVAFPTIVPVEELIYTATTSSLSLVATAIDADGNLRLTPVVNAVGTATITVRAASVFNAADFVEDSFTVTLRSTTVPSAPSIASTVAANGQVTVGWIAPTNTGGAAITNYLVKYSTNNGLTFTNFVHPVSAALSWVVTGLTNGTPYRFKVVAVNSSGISPPSALSAAVTPVTIPSAPSIASTVAANGQVTVGWIAPTNTGGAAITNYLVKYSTNNGLTFTNFVHPVSAALSWVVTGLTNGTPYRFKVVAVNSSVISPPSALSAAVTPVTIPSAPSIASTVAGNGQVTVRWMAPTNTGGAAITNYLVKFSTNNGLTFTNFVHPVSAALSWVVTGLTNGTPYRFKVVAVNSSGISPPSALSAAVTPVAIPSAPSIASTVAGNGQVTVGWIAPTNAGGSPITNYLVKFSTNNGLTFTNFVHPVSAALSWVVTGLTNGTPYRFKVVAVNSSGISPPSALSTPAAPVLAFTQPQGLYATGPATTASVAVATLPTTYFNVLTGELQFDPVGRDVTSLILHTSANFFSYGQGHGVGATSSNTVQRTFPLGGYSFAPTTTATMLGAAIFTLTAGSSGSSASTNGFWNKAWSFGTGANASGPAATYTPAQAAALFTPTTSSSIDVGFGTDIDQFSYTVNGVIGVQFGRVIAFTPS